MTQRPNFEDITDYQEFRKYYWYREELMNICKELKIEHMGTKPELNHIIEEYYKGNIIEKKKRNEKKTPFTEELTLSTKLIECNFSCNQKFRDFFSEQTGIKNFKFTVNMVASAKKAKQDKDIFFTLQDMLDVYYGKKEYAINDNSSCEWNQFLKDFSADKKSNEYFRKLKVAAILWKEVRNSTKEKIYTEDLLLRYEDKIRDYKKENL